MNESIGYNIREKRRAKKLSQAELAALSGVSQSAISAIEKGDRSPSAETLELISVALGTTVSQLLGEDAATRPATDEEIRFALFGGDAKEISDAQYQEVLRFAQYIKARDKK